VDIGVDVLFRVEQKLPTLHEERVDLMESCETCFFIYRGSKRLEVLVESGVQTANELVDSMREERELFDDIGSRVVCVSGLYEAAARRRVQVL
jgi:thymidylate synthase